MASPRRFVSFSRSDLRQKTVFESFRLLCLFGQLDQPFPEITRVKYKTTFPLASRIS
jgi:hypothetical protein